MKLYLTNTGNIYFPQIKNYFREIVSSYDNGNYRSAMVMLYSTIVCDLLLKIKELSEVYSDTKASQILNYVERKRKESNKSAWEWELIEKIYKETELLNDESYKVIEHIYDLRNFSAHPALTEDYELVSPTPEMTVAYIKKSLDDIFTKPSVFAQNIVDRMSDDIASKKDIYYGNSQEFKNYLKRAYLQRMSPKMTQQVFKAFWKFTFIKAEGEVFESNRLINRKVLESILDYNGEVICKFIEENMNYFSVSQSSNCLTHVCVLCAYYPRVYHCLEQNTQYQLISFDENSCELIKWFIVGDLDQHVAMFKSSQDLLPRRILDVFRKICERQGQSNLFNKLIIKHYAQSTSFASARNRFDFMVKHYMEHFTAVDFIELIDVINNNDQIYNYGWQTERNDQILEIALPLLPSGFNLSKYENFSYTHPKENETTDASSAVAENQNGESTELLLECGEVSQ